MQALIEAGGLHVYYGASHVLRGVDMHIAPGESVGLVGRNGMGKTTLIRSLMGQVKSAQGLVRIGGRDCTHAQPHTIARLGLAYVP
jgi:branched-chain amino acid transport system ATP-binding protein